jgi:nucleotide-binding universal stress UspA family protein
MLRSILSPVDFSEQSRQALRWAGAFATRFRSRLTVLNAVDPLLAEAAKIRFGRDLASEETEPALREFVAATWPGKADPTASAIFRVAVGEPTAVILGTAASEEAELIVMGTQGLGGFRKWLLGSTTERLLRLTDVPVLAVPPASTTLNGARSDDGAVAVERILAATDFSGSSVAAVAYAAQLAHQLSATLTLAHVVEPLAVPPQWRLLAQESDETRIAGARARLEQLAKPLGGAGTVVSLGRPDDAIGSVAKERRAQLIVMGLTSGQGPLARRPGSIAYRVLCASEAPVLFVPASWTAQADRD